uniref:Serine/threonine-protein phosphatase n=1 Tax=Setaria digitata TaxID=48799 RepID=A0A915PS92_9BILA
MRFLESTYERYGRYIAKHPMPFMLLPILTTILSTAGLLRFHIDNDIWNIYSPINGLARVEEKALKRFEYASGAHHYRLQVLVNRKDGGNLMNVNNTDEILKMERFVVNNVTITDGFSFFTYHNICGVYCSDSNDIVLTFIKAAIDMNDKTSSSLAFTFPNARLFESHIFMGYSVGDIHWSKQDPKIVDGFKLFILHFMFFEQVNLDLPHSKRIAKNFESQLRTLFALATYESKELKYSLFSRDREIEEQQQITLAALPFLGAFFAVLSPAMALITSWGLLWGIGLPFSNILTAIPFLVVTIGVDDAFLILAAWRHANPASDLETRMGETLTYSGASVTVTSLTDVLCFMVGLVSNLPVVRLFCIYTSISIMVDFIYQVRDDEKFQTKITFFTAVVAYCGGQKVGNIEKKYREQNSKSKNVMDGLWRKIEPAESHKVYSVEVGVARYCFSDGNSLPLKKPPKKSQTSLQKFVNILHLPFTKGIVIAAFIIHIIVISYFCTKVSTDFDMENLYLESSVMNGISRQLQRFNLNEAFVVNFALYPMPNFADVFIRNKFDHLVEELETIPKFGMGSDGTVLWTRDFADAVAFWGDESNFWRQDKLLSAFREYEMDEKFITTEKTADGTEVISGFFWSITYHNMNNFLDVRKLMQLRRSIIAKYAKFFNVSSHHPLEKVPTESAASASTNFIQTAFSAVVLMSALVYFFITNLCAVITVVISILSISFGALAYLHLWNVRLDAISLISLLMSIGFSVDYSAHICYHYLSQKDNEKKKSDEHCHQPISIIVGSDANLRDLSILPSNNSSIRCTNSGVNTKQRFLITFRGVGWPVVQSGLSTLLGILPMVMVKAYVVAVFWKTIILLIGLGLIHALILLPVILIICDDMKFNYTVLELLPILNEAKKLFLTEPTLLYVEVPCVIIGDIHGQYEDLHRIFSVLGEGKKSGAVKRRFVFLGDYVDRGTNSLETICCLLAHKLMFPKMFNMLRGNHESSDVNQAYGFQVELYRRFPENNEGFTLWNAFNELFACLPLAALIRNKILCIHGGIGPELKSLDDIRKIKRPMPDPTDSPLACSLLWSDPMLDLKGFIKNSVRGAGYFFGEDAVIACCEQLHIDLIVRAHQVLNLIEYLDYQNNKCAILQVEKDLRLGFILLCPVTPETQGKLLFYGNWNRH